MDNTFICPHCGIKVTFEEGPYICYCGYLLNDKKEVNTISHTVVMNPVDEEGIIHNVQK